MEIKYEQIKTVNGEALLCVTSCPFSTEPLNLRTKVSSIKCVQCPYFGTINLHKKIVTCNHEK